MTDEEEMEKLDDAKVGDGVTVHLWTDAYACTVIKKTEKQMIVQRDEAIRLDDPITIPGGFVGHTINNRAIRYRYERDENGQRFKAFKRAKDGKWMRSHTKNLSISTGRHEFYDYNF